MDINVVEDTPCEKIGAEADKPTVADGELDVM